MRYFARWTAGVGALLAVAACGVPNIQDAPPSMSPAVSARLVALDAALTAWASAGTLTQAKASAETVRNLVTGPSVMGYGDLDGDGHTRGANDVGLLPGERGQAGLVTGPVSRCVERDVLGGSWADPGARWADLRTRVQRWSPTNNTFPALSSHPQRIVGWASLALRSASLDDAHEFAGHARLHLTATRAAFEDCAG